MKKLFTLCAAAAMAFTLSAQADISAGSMFLYTSDATQFVKQANGYDLDVNFGYAVQDNIVLSVGMAQNQDHLDNNSINLGVRYFWKGLFFQASVGDATQNLMDLVGTGEYVQVGTGEYEQVGTGTYEQVGSGEYEQIDSGELDADGNIIYVDGDEILVDGDEIMMDGDEIMTDGAEITEDVQRGRSFTAGVGYLMQLDNVFDSGVMSNMYIEPYMGVFSSTSEENITFSTALRLGYRF